MTSMCESGALQIGLFQQSCVHTHKPASDESWIQVHHEHDGSPASTAWGSHVFCKTCAVCRSPRSPVSRVHSPVRNDTTDMGWLALGDLHLHFICTTSILLYEPLQQDGTIHTFLSGLYRRLNKSRMWPMMNRMVQLHSTTRVFSPLELAAGSSRERSNSVFHMLC